MFEISCFNIKYVPARWRRLLNEIQNGVDSHKSLFLCAELFQMKIVERRIVSCVSFAGPFTWKTQNMIKMHHKPFSEPRPFYLFLPSFELPLQYQFARILFRHYNNKILIPHSTSATPSCWLPPAQRYRVC